MGNEIWFWEKDFFGVGKLSFTQRVILICLSSGLIVGLTSILIVKKLIYTQFTAELRTRNLTLTQNLALSCRNHIPIGNKGVLTKLFSTTQQLNPEIKYIYLLNKHYVPVESTVPRSLTDHLIRQNRVDTKTQNAIHFVNFGNEKVVGITVPVNSDEFGILHVGFAETKFNVEVRKFVVRLALMMLLILFCVLTITYGIIKITVDPFRQLNLSLKKIRTGNYVPLNEVKGNEEINLIIRTFNEIVEKLNKSAVKLETVQSQLVQNVKMATVGQFAAGIAHEINNPLGAVINCIRIVLAYPEVKGEIKGNLELSLKGLFRIENIVKKILRYSRVEHKDLRLTNVDQLLQETLSLLQHKILEKQINLVLNLNSPIANILADPVHLQQVFTNLINNAVDALDRDGKLTIDTFLTEKEINIRFVDTGIGIKSTDLDKVFDPFFTTKEVGKGTGLGLFISYNIIKMYHGKIEIESTEGKGTAVLVTLPSVS